MDRIQLVARIGSGSYATVYRARRHDGSMVAVKELKESTSDNDILSMNEVALLRTLGFHDNLVQLQDVRVVDGIGYLIMDLCGESLYTISTQFASKNRRFRELEIKTVMRDVLQGLSHMHSKRVIHRDLKPDNVLLGYSSRANDVVCKIGDFGQATQAGRGILTQYVATRWYRAPELLLQSNRYDTAVDIWACGCLMAELLLLTPLFPGTSDLDQLHRIKTLLGSPKENSLISTLLREQHINLPFSANNPSEALASSIPSASPVAIDLLQKMLQWNPADRWSASQLLKHPFFNGSFVSLDFYSGKPIFKSSDDTLAVREASVAQKLLSERLCTQKNTVIGGCTSSVPAVKVGYPANTTMSNPVKTREISSKDAESDDDVKNDTAESYPPVSVVASVAHTPSNLTSQSLMDSDSDDEAERYLSMLKAKGVK